MTAKHSIKGKILFITIAALALQSLMVSFGFSWLLETADDNAINRSAMLLIVVAVLLLSIVLLTVLLQLIWRPIERLLSAIETGVSSFKDQDFSITIHKAHDNELGKIVDAYNDMANTLCEERMSLFQREMLLDTIIQSSPVSVILTDHKGYVIYANGTAQQLFNHKSRLEGTVFKQLLEKLPEELRKATEAEEDGLVSMMSEHEKVSYYLHCQTFYLNSSEHHLYLYKNLTSELSRQEIDLWKKAIRLISHELNNSLAPISSLANSAKRMLASEKQIDSLPDIIDTISQRVQKLNGFLREYAEFARLPAPRKNHVLLPEFVENIQKLCSFNITAPVPEVHLDADTAQLEQVLLNLYKNAVESGSDKHKIALFIEVQSSRLFLTVSDAGGGMSQNQLQQALLPFYTTKQAGSGLGLSLCNEILTAHNGLIRLQNNSNPGLNVTLILPL